MEEWREGVEECGEVEGGCRGRVWRGVERWRRGVEGGWCGKVKEEGCGEVEVRRMCGWIRGMEECRGEGGWYRRGRRMVWMINGLFEVSLRDSNTWYVVTLELLGKRMF